MGRCGTGWGGGTPSAESRGWLEEGQSDTGGGRRRENRHVTPLARSRTYKLFDKMLQFRARLNEKVEEVQAMKERVIKGDAIDDLEMIEKGTAVSIISNIFPAQIYVSFSFLGLLHFPRPPPPLTFL